MNFFDVLQKNMADQVRDDPTKSSGFKDLLDYGRNFVRTFEMMCRHCPGKKVKTELYFEQAVSILMVCPPDSDEQRAPAGEDKVIEVIGMKVVRGMDLIKIIIQDDNKSPPFAVELKMARALQVIE